MKKLTLLQFLSLGLFIAASCLAGPEQPMVAGDNLLTSAGFRVRKAESAEQRLIYAVSPSYRMLRAGTRREPFFVYKDEGEGVAYVGGEAEFQRFQQLAAQEGYARGFYLAKDLDLDLAWRLSQAFGPPWSSGELNYK